VWVVTCGGRRGLTDFHVVAHCLLFFYKIDTGNLLTLIRMFQHAPMLPIFDVYIGRNLVDGVIENVTEI